MRNKSAIWSKFGAVYKPPGGVDDGDDGNKSKYCKCSACDEPAIAASGCLRDHWEKCKKRPRAIGLLNAGFQPSQKKAAKKPRHDNDLSPESTACSSSARNMWSNMTKAQSGLGTFFPSGNTVGDSSFFSGGRQHFDSLKAGEAQKLNMLFSHAIHCTATPYSAFEHLDWKHFFRSLQGCYKLPTRLQIGDELMAREYTETLNKFLLSLGKQQLICYTLDGATNLQGKQIINMMACIPNAFFGTLHDCSLSGERCSRSGSISKLRLLRSICVPAPGFSLSRDIVVIGEGHNF
jgi:hypothetical protein